jgi:hypothetical protein
MIIRYSFVCRTDFAVVQCSAGFQTCCIAGFQAGKTSQKLSRSADLEIRDTADLEVLRYKAAASFLRRSYTSNAEAFLPKSHLIEVPNRSLRVSSRFASVTHSMYSRRLLGQILQMFFRAFAFFFNAALKVIGPRPTALASSVGCGPVL